MSMSTAAKDRVGPRSPPPFRADHVGSLLRPGSWPQAARGEHKAGSPAAEGLARPWRTRCIADGDPPAGGDRAAGRDRRRVPAGLLALRFRLRAGWRRAVRAGAEDPVQGRRAAAACAAGDRADPLEQAGDGGRFPFLASHVRTAVPKQTIPSPVRGAFPRRPAARSIAQDLSGAWMSFFADLGRRIIRRCRAFAAAGCRYLQLDEVNIAYLCDPEQIAGLKARGEHVEKLLADLRGHDQSRDRGAAARYDD